MMIVVTQPRTTLPDMPLTHNKNDSCNIAAKEVYMKLLTFLSFISLLCSCGTTRIVTTSSNPVVAHRGAWKANNLPENSIASLRQAIALGCTGSEFDVRMTADDSLIINHDPAFNGLQIEQHTYAELIKTPLSNGEKLPTLREYILAGLTNNAATTLVVEIKPSDISKERAKTIAAKVYQIIVALNASSKVQYISFDYDILLTLEQLNKKVITQYLNGDKAPEQLKADGIDGADYHYSVFQKNPEWITALKKDRLIVNAWTVNEAKDMLWLIDSGADYITTNEPELLIKLMKEKKQ